MRKTIYSFLLLILFLPVQAQEDTLRHSPWNHMWVPATGTLLMATGSAFTFVPEMKNVAVDLRDAIQADGHESLLFDNYLQYFPAITAPVLNLCGVESKHGFRKLLLLEGGSYLLGSTLLYAGKYGLGVLRPDGRARTSFPSGHTFTAFTGAEVLRHEYGDDYPWLVVAGYAVATLVGAMRIYNNRHWVGDVLAGAGLGIVSVNLTYWILDKR